MIMDYGTAAKHLRLDRELKLKDVENRFISKSSLSKFENGKSGASFPGVVESLLNMGINLEEYELLISSESRETLDVIYSIETLIHKKSVNGLIKLLDKLDYKKTKDNLLIKYVLNILILSLSQQPIPLNLCEDFQKYILSKGKWYGIEYFSYFYTYMVFNKEISHIIYHNIERNKHTQTYLTHYYQSKILTEIKPA